MASFVVDETIQILPLETMAMIAIEIPYYKKCVHFLLVSKYSSLLLQDNDLFQLRLQKHYNITSKRNVNWWQLEHELSLQRDLSYSEIFNHACETGVVNTVKALIDLECVTFNEIKVHLLCYQEGLEILKLLLGYRKEYLTKKLDEVCTAIQERNHLDKLKSVPSDYELNSSDLEIPNIFKDHLEFGRLFCVYYKFHKDNASKKSMNVSQLTDIKISALRLQREEMNTKQLSDTKVSKLQSEEINNIASEYLKFHDDEVFFQHYLSTLSK